jgi:hypothetical protein
MIIQFNKDLKLDDWEDPYHCGTIFYRQSFNYLYVRIAKHKYDWSIAFYKELDFMNFMCNINYNKSFKHISLDNQADFVKQQVDDFILRISKLKAFI